MNLTRHFQIFEYNLEQVVTQEVEFQTFFNLGIDGVFTDYPGTGVQARQEWIQTLK